MMKWAPSLLVRLALAVSFILFATLGCENTGPPSPGSASPTPPFPTRVTNSLGMDLVRISPGEFLMGAPKSERTSAADERPEHRVRITRPFHFGVHEVTQEEMARLLPNHVNAFVRGADGKDSARFPADMVTWYDAVKFCRLLSELPEEKSAGRAYRLPTEAEWEYACRAGTRTPFSCGESLSARQANFRGDEPYGDAAKGDFLVSTKTVGSYAPNAFGLHDMHGNVWEWCFDRYHVDYYQSSPTDDPRGPDTGNSRVIRGGGWYSDARDCRSAFRNSDQPDGTFYVLGFRIVMVPASSFDSRKWESLPRSEAVPLDVTASVETQRDPSLKEGEDWPRWRGPRGNGTWRAGELPEKWPSQGLRRLWRQPIGGGYSGIAVTDGRAVTLDRQTDPEEVERVLCFAAATGELLWKVTYPVAYNNLQYGNGPRATPSIADGLVYTIGAVGDVYCITVDRGERVWTRNLERDFKAPRPGWGFSAAPLLYKNLLLIHAGARPDGCILALDQKTGKEVWRRLTDPAGYATPILMKHQGQPLLVTWTPSNVHGLDPSTGNVHWSLPFQVTHGTSIAAPVSYGDIIIVSGYWDGSKAIRLGESIDEAEFVWKDRRNMRALMSQALVRDGHGYLLDKRHGLTCFHIGSGKKLWDDANRMTPKGRNPQATMVWAGGGDRALVLNSDGELILARLRPSGYREESRVRLIGPTWAHPSYAGDRVFARDDTEIICASLTD